jgi:hypothetical protein
MEKRTKRKGNKKRTGPPDQAWLERLNENVRESAEIQELLKAFKQAGCFLDDIAYFLYAYCAWDRVFVSRMAKWREHFLERYKTAEETLLKVASDLEGVNQDTYLSGEEWAQVFRDSSAELRKDLVSPAAVASEEDGCIVGITPVDLTLDLPRQLRLFADHLRQLRSAASVAMFARRLGRNYQLVELYEYLRCVNGSDPAYDEIALLIGAAVDHAVEPDLIERNVENFREMNPWLCKLTEQKFSKYAQYCMRARGENKPVTPYHKWTQDRQS